MTPTHVARWSRPLTLTILLLLPLATHSQSAVLSPGELRARLDESSKALRDLVVARDKLPASAAKLQDKRGRTLKDDLQQNVMPPETQDRLTTLQAGATTDLQAQDLPGAQINIARMQQILATEIERYSAISDYWKNVGWKPRHDNDPRGAESNATGIDSPVAREIDILSAQFDQQIAARDFVMAMRTTWVKLDELETRARKEEERRILANIGAGDLQPLRSVGPGQKKCPPAGRTSGSGKPVVRVKQFPRTIDYYPGPGKPSGPANQTVELFVAVNAEGCAERVFLIKGAERPEFDEGALQMAADGRYIPAEKNGNAVPGGFTLRITF